VKRILVVDDDDDMRDLIVNILSPEYEVASACDGAKGLEAARAAAPDLVVLDLLMPKMHGFEVVSRLRADEKLKKVKVLISSSKSYQNDMKTAVEESGADDYIVKPFEIDDFKARIAALLARD
jgi:DNA-binding response OmpR family regulator